ncbi:MAG TPA: ComEC/Rec2 family competence protein [Thermomicrobiales bacterium]|nr:ComEC/Rec2 family competence protein [Thermomicrobiales bacterium]
MPTGFLIGLAAMAGVALGGRGILVAVMVTLGFLLLDAFADDRPDALRVIVATALVLVAASFGALRGTPDLPVPDPRLEGAESAIGIVRSMPQPGGRFDTAMMTVESVDLADGTTLAVSLPVLASFPVSLRANIGDRVVLGGEFTPLAGLEPGYRRYVEGRQAVGVFRGYGASILSEGTSPRRLLVDMRRDLADRLRRAIPGDAGALAAGIVTGDDSALRDETADAFRAAGLSHVTAVSGQNIAMLAGIVPLLLRGRARQRLPMQIGILIAVWLYVGMTGFGAPAIRAGVFVTCAFAATWFGRRPDFLTILALASGGMLLACPAYVASVSFWLSMAASAALVTAFGWPSGGAMAWVTRSVAALTTAQLATVPIAIAIFGAWSPGSVLANLIVGPLMQVAFPLCFLLALCLYVLPFVAAFVAVAAELPLVLTIWTANAVSGAFPQSDLAAGGFLVVLAAAIPCVAGIAWLSEDARRWGRRQGARFSGEPADVAAAIGGIAVGCAVVLLVGWLA